MLNSANGHLGFMYSVQTKEVNQAIKNNPEKFPEGYVIVLTDSEKAEVVKIFDHLAKLKFSSAPIKAIKRIM
jgi:heptaprenylglyceryl phosphate synthase